MQNLQIGWNKVEKLPVAVENFTNLETLNLSCFGLTEFSEVLCKLKSLKDLQIGWNRIDSIKGTSENFNLETLNLSRCGLTEIPPIFCKLRLLKNLHIGGNEEIRNLPGTFQDVTNLETLNLSNCGLSGFPQVLCKLKSLRELDIDSNKNIQSLPESLTNLPNLERLNASNCDLVNCKETGLNSSFSRLRELDISANHFTSLPLFLFELKSLQKLDISTNPITRLPKGIRRCSNLEELNISHCEIKGFPTVIFHMRKLSTVLATDVSIEELDEDFVKLWSQRSDIFAEGRFQKVVGLRPVRFVKPPNEIVQHGPDACMEYYRALRVGNAFNCSILNVTLMGKTGAGKSSLIHSIKEESSVLIDPSDRTVVVDTIEVKQEDVLLKIADFGGHDIYEKIDVVNVVHMLARDVDIAKRCC